MSSCATVEFVSPPRFLWCPSRRKAERVHELNEEIGKLLARAEQLGGEGNVDEAQQLLEKVEKTRALKKEAEVRDVSDSLRFMDVMDDTESLDISGGFNGVGVR